jgi:hypothetical protein
MLRPKARHNPTDRDLRELTEELEPLPAAPAEATPVVSEEEIRYRAYCLWNAAGWPASDGVEFWLQAERELRGS